MTLAINEVSELDKETRNLVSMYSAARIKVGLEVAQRLAKIETENLYKKLDERAYPTFKSYIDSLGIAYKTARELIGLYDSFIIAGECDIDKLAEKPYHKLTAIKSYFFKKRDNKYHLLHPISELNKWLKEIDSDITIDDLRQKRREAEVGEHQHNFDIMKIRICRICKLRERF